jgi:periplasmic copper chaperone A
MRIAVLLLLAFAAAPAWAQIQVENAWSRATAPGVKIAAGYMMLRNRGTAPDRLVGVASSAARKVETHVTVRDGNIMRMREVGGYDIPAGGAMELKPGGAHLMFVDVRKPFKEGERIPVTLRFEHAGEVQVDFEVARSAPGHGHAGH